MSKILIVEDEKNISKLIEDTLALANYHTDVSFDGKEAITKITTNKYDLILMDIMLPEMDGFEICEKIGNIDTPIIFLTAKNDITSVVRGLKSGVDYMTKPFEPLELLARIELRIKKSKNIYHYKNIVLNNLTKEVTMDDKIVFLSKKEYELLLLFLENIDIVLKREELLTKVWQVYAEIETRTIDFHIGELRKKLNLKNDLITVHGLGYRLKKSGQNED